MPLKVAYIGPHIVLPFTCFKNLLLKLKVHSVASDTQGGSRTAAISKMEHLMILVNGFKPLTTITKRSILDVAAFLDRL